MYSGGGFSKWEIGDIDVFIHNGKYHLFHLIIPNHDYIAHATSEDGINWKRNKNALFVGHPGEWDDDMLWTMHVSQEQDYFVMYYTGLKREDQGDIQKIGKAKSSDLIHWEKDTSFEPIGSDAPYYECSETNNPRQWLSFRDPFLFRDNDKTHLLICARGPEGFVSRRGCIGLATLEDQTFKLKKQLFSPMVYDDVECPCAFTINGIYYLIGSIREDLKIRYWFSDKFKGTYASFNSNVLLPKGNYAGRVVKDGDHLLVYAFYFAGKSVDTFRIITPPKEIVADEKGRLKLKSFYRWEEKVTKIIPQTGFNKTEALLGNPTSVIIETLEERIVSTKSGYELFGCKNPFRNFIWEGELHLYNLGKCGLVFNSDENGNGYYISFDYLNGFVQIRQWGHNDQDIANNFIFKNLQINQFERSENKSVTFSLIAYGTYIELSINGIVRLTLVDSLFQGGYIGIYCSSGKAGLTNSYLKKLAEPETEYGIKQEQH
ncbi:glycosyl hydrolase family 32 [Flavicella sp.]|uniref:glycosyl hydrolase family 32 n=1 Tax=Flavicella sp. TaxID=2957742 RepID=UPI00262480CA|nr:glycosyl hydrolase family 32 [Flavicella sp.]MDG1804881.1 glycosyl hydrolase family 32 [Flavicella sp.]